MCPMNKVPVLVSMTRFCAKTAIAVLEREAVRNSLRWFAKSIAGQAAFPVCMIKKLLFFCFSEFQRSLSTSRRNSVTENSLQEQEAFHEITRCPCGAASAKLLISGPSDADSVRREGEAKFHFQKLQGPFSRRVEQRRRQDFPSWNAPFSREAVCRMWAASSTYQTSESI